MPQHGGGLHSSRPTGLSSFGAASALVGVTPRGSPPTTPSRSSPLHTPSRTLTAQKEAALHNAARTWQQGFTLPSSTACTTDKKSSMALVRAMKGLEVTGLAGAHVDPDYISDEGDGADSDHARSVCSNGSNFSVKSTMSTMSSYDRDKRHSHSSSSSKTRSMHMSFNECSIEIEQALSSDQSAKLGLCTEFQQLCREDGQGDGFLQCLSMYGYEAPNKLQQHAIPAILQHLGRQLGGKACVSGKGKGCMFIQGPKGSGKTSSVVLGLLATIDLSLPQPQAILLSGASKRDFDKYLNIFTLMDSISFQAFMPDDDGNDTPLDENSPKVKAARFAHILIGPPRQMLKLLSSVSSLCLDAVRALVIDDAEELLYTVPDAKGAAGWEGAQQKLAAGSGISSGSVGVDEETDIARGPGGGSRPSKPASVADRHEALSPESPQSTSSTFGSSRRSPAPFTRADLRVEPAQTLSSMPVVSPLLDDLVKICQVLECRKYSQNMSDTFRIRSGQEQGTKLRYFILMESSTDPASRKIVRHLKNAMMKKKTISSTENCPPPTKAIKSMKHYYAQAPHSEWVRIFAGLVQSLMFPRAVIFCDDANIKKFYHEMLSMGIAVSANLPASSGHGADTAGGSDSRRQAVQDFTSNKSQFLLTPSEPAICQIVLPKVSCMFHFGIPADMPSMYAIRLQILDTELAKDAASIFFVDGAKIAAGQLPPVVAGVGKLFEIRFLDMPFEFLPTMQGSNRFDASARRMRSGSAIVA